MEPERIARLAESARQLALIVEQLVGELDAARIDYDATIVADVRRLRTIANRLESTTSAACGGEGASAGPEAPTSPAVG